MVTVLILYAGLMVCVGVAINNKTSMSFTLGIVGALGCIMLLTLSCTDDIYKSLELEEIVEEEYNIASVPSSGENSFVEEISIGKHNTPATIYYIKTSTGTEKRIAEDRVVYRNTITGKPFVKICHYRPKNIWARLFVNPAAVYEKTTVFYIPLR